jgi:ABC-type transport system substrate-binding protein
MEDSEWVDNTTLEIRLRPGVVYQNGEELSVDHILRAFDEVQKWKAPHPPGTYLNFHPDTRMEVTGDMTVRMIFPAPDGLALAKFRGLHVPSIEFWENEGFGPRAIGTAEGHW